MCGTLFEGEEERIVRKRIVAWVNVCACMRGMCEQRRVWKYLRDLLEELEPLPNV